MYGSRIQGTCVYGSKIWSFYYQFVVNDKTHSMYLTCHIYILVSNLDNAIYVCVCQYGTSLIKWLIQQDKKSGCIKTSIKIPHFLPEK